MTALFGSIALAFHGVQTQSTELAVLGTLYALVLSIGILATQGRLLLGPDDITLGKVSLVALSYWLGRSVSHALGTVGTQSVTAFSAPTQSYLSFLTQTLFDVQVYINQTLAALVENSAMIGGAAVTVLGLTAIGLPPVAAFVLAAGTFSLAFAYLHGAVTIGFVLIAGGIMLVWMLITLGDDLEIVAVPFLLAGYPATVGLHQGNNIEAGGGLVNYYTTLWNAQNLGFAGKAQVLVELGLLVLALYGVYYVAVHGRDLWR